jgi:hypothetical protein
MLDAYLIITRQHQLDNVAIKKEQFTTRSMKEWRGHIMFRDTISSNSWVSSVFLEHILPISTINRAASISTKLNPAY